MSEAEINIHRHPTRRGVYVLQTRLIVPAPLDDVFAFFSSAQNLEQITPPWLKFSIVSELPSELKEGSLIDYRLRLHGIPIRWQSEIAAWDPPHRFVDRQVRGPYLLWHHEHIFTPGEGGTHCEDLVHYAVPGGRLAHWLLVRRDLIKIFRYRAEQLQARFSPG